MLIEEDKVRTFIEQNEPMRSRVIVLLHLGDVELAAVVEGPSADWSVLDFDYEFGRALILSQHQVGKVLRAKPEIPAARLRADANRCPEVGHDAVIEEALNVLLVAWNEFARDYPLGEHRPSLIEGIGVLRQVGPLPAKTLVRDA